MWWKSRPCISQYFNMTLIPADLLGRQHCFWFSIFVSGVTPRGFYLLFLLEQSAFHSQGPQVGILPAIEYISFSSASGIDRIITLSLCTHWAYCEKTLGQTQLFSDFLNSTDGWNTVMFWITSNLGATLFVFPLPFLQASFTLGNEKPWRELHGAWLWFGKIFLKGSSYSLRQGTLGWEGSKRLRFLTLYSS